MHKVTPPNEFAFIDDSIGKIPVVGAVWADALYVWLGQLHAYALAALRDESLASPYRAFPARATVIQPEPLLRRAA